MACPPQGGMRGVSVVELLLLLTLGRRLWRLRAMPYYGQRRAKGKVKGFCRVLRTEIVSVPPFASFQERFAMVRALRLVCYRRR